jgi:hypothetical protein
MARNGRRLHGAPGQARRALLEVGTLESIPEFVETGLPRCPVSQKIENARFHRGDPLSVTLIQLTHDIQNKTADIRLRRRHPRQVNLTGKQQLEFVANPRWPGWRLETRRMERDSRSFTGFIQQFDVLAANADDPLDLLS